MPRRVFPTREARHAACSLPSPVLKVRPLWKRGLTLYDSVEESLGIAPDPDEVGVHARSRFRHIARPERFAMYSVHGVHMADGTPPAGRLDDHTLVAVREFRRVPLDASALSLMLFNARPGCTARVLAALAHWVERAVSLYQPAYILLAHSLEHPGTIALLAGVHECAALQAARSSAFSLDGLLGEVQAWLTSEPECYLYCPGELTEALEGAASGPRTVSPDAV